MVKRIYWLVMLAGLPLALLSQGDATLFYSGDMPMGNVAVTMARERPMQYFFTIHPESRPEGARVFEVRDGKAFPFPDSAFQDQFVSPLGIYLDRQHRLWVLDHANYALKTPHLYAFDAMTGELLIDHAFSREVVRKWVMLNDLTVTPDGKHVVISAPGMFRKRSAIVVYDVAGDTARRILTDHGSVMRKKCCRRWMAGRCVSCWGCSR